VRTWNLTTTKFLSRKQPWKYYWLLISKTMRSGAQKISHTQSTFFLPNDGL
jgi:hypothetical protein